jgi:hypothetical protein
VRASLGDCLDDGWTFHLLEVLYLRLKSCKALRGHGNLFHRLVLVTFPSRHGTTELGGLGGATDQSPGTFQVLAEELQRSPRRGTEPAADGINIATRGPVFKNRGSCGLSENLYISIT